MSIVLAAIQLIAYPFGFPVTQTISVCLPVSGCWGQSSNSHPFSTSPFSTSQYSTMSTTTTFGTRLPASKEPSGTSRRRCWRPPRRGARRRPRCGRGRRYAIFGNCVPSSEVGAPADITCEAGRMREVLEENSRLLILRILAVSPIPAVHV